MTATVTTTTLALRTLPLGFTASTVPVSWWEGFCCTWTTSVAAVTSTVAGTAGVLATGDGLRVAGWVGAAAAGWLVWGGTWPAALTGPGPGLDVAASTTTTSTATA